MADNEDITDKDDQEGAQQRTSNKYFNFRFDEDLDLSISGIKRLFLNLLPLNITKLFVIVFLGSVTISVGFGLYLLLPWIIEGGYQDTFSSVTNRIDAVLAFNTNVWRLDDIEAYDNSSLFLVSIGLSCFLFFDFNNEIL